MAADTASATSQGSDIELESGTYEIISQRLSTQAGELRQRLGQLNEERKKVFGSIETKLLATERVTTEHNCVPRDIVAVGRFFLFGFNVQFGLKTERRPEDVFAVHEFRDGTFHEQPLTLLEDAQFQRDFEEIYRYYKDATFSQFFLSGPHLYMVFRTGREISDIKAFKWLFTDTGLQYIDNRSDHEVRYPPQHEFEWTRTTRDEHFFGKHPHVSIADRLFVETIGGDLTIKVENNTDSGEGIHDEPVDNADQTLDDAEIFYAILGHLILLKIRPYQEPDYRYFVYNEKLQSVVRLDELATSCVLLPDDQGLIFPGGYYLQSGEFKTFDHSAADMLFARRVTASNGEDTLFVFHHRLKGVYVLLQYNCIEQAVETPLICHGFTIFQEGELLCFRTHEEPQRHHPLQVWQTPFTSDTHVPAAHAESYLYKVGNRDIVRGMAECHEILALIGREEAYASLYLDIEKIATEVVDSYFWIDAEEAFRPGEILKQIRETAASAVEEYEKVRRAQRQTAEQTRSIQEKTRETLATVNRRRFETIQDYVASLGELRLLRGGIIGLRELRYVDLPLVEKLEQEVSEQSERLARRCVEFLLKPAALEPYQQKVTGQHARIAEVAKVAQAKELEEEIKQTAAELEMLIDVVSNLKIDDTTQRTAIVDAISQIFTRINQARAALKKRAKELMSVEAAAEFSSQLRLLDQGVTNYLDLCRTPEKCDEFLTKLMVQIEELEGRFAEFDEFVVQLSEKRDEIYSIFEARKVELVEARNKRAAALASAADRILKGIQTRVGSLETVQEINAYFAADLMVDKVRDICGQLESLGDTVKLDEIQSRLKTVQEDALRQLRDKQELFVEGENVLQFGRHRFHVNTQPLDLTTVVREGDMLLHLTGTNFFEPLDDPGLTEAQDLWNRETISENEHVYRGEYLAYLLWQRSPEDIPLKRRQELRTSEPARLDWVREFMAPRYTEGYVKGVTDQDAARILSALWDLDEHLGLLRYPAPARSLAQLYWRFFLPPQEKELLTARLQGVGRVEQWFPRATPKANYVHELQDRLAEFVERRPLFSPDSLEPAARYLYDEISSSPDFAVSHAAEELARNFQEHLHHQVQEETWRNALTALEKDPASAFQLACDAARAFVREHADPEREGYVEEVALRLLTATPPKRVLEGEPLRVLKDMVGTHPVLEGGNYRLNFHTFFTKLRNFAEVEVPRYEEFHALKKNLVAEHRQGMRLDEFKPRVLTSFVRNRLIDTVYLPLIGDNLAKQCGAAGDQKRTDRMGLLLLVSPPGYGKTTLMEYVANRLGLTFMKINGPAIGHRVMSLDPAEAPNAGAREEIRKLNLSLEMGDNVMIYVDDIQHCHPEFLQKFISLCDAQRKIEGVWNGQPRTYDLRGRKVAVVMAGNPYTESGEKFQIPDMLSNRADIYNLGDIIGDSADVFEMSYIENCATSNTVLNRVAHRHPQDVHTLLKVAEQGGTDGFEWEGNYSADEMQELVSVMRKLLRVRDVVLTVNQEYIRSAAQADAYRTEPPFKLQGSYRNMNRIAERVVSIMNDAELETLILSNYENDAQTLTSDAEANLLKLNELLGNLTPEEAQRWEAIKATFQRQQKLKGAGGDDRLGQVVVQLEDFRAGLDQIGEAVRQGASFLTPREDQASSQVVTPLVEHLGHLQTALTEWGGQFTENLEKWFTQPPRPVKVTVPAQPGYGSEAKTTAEIQDSSPSPTLDGGAPLQVTVVSRIPRSFLQVMQQQFQVMESWLSPLLASGDTQSRELVELRQTLADCTQKYEQLIEELETSLARSRDRNEVDGG